MPPKPLRLELLATSIRGEKQSTYREKVLMSLLFGVGGPLSHVTSTPKRQGIMAGILNSRKFNATLGRIEHALETRNARTQAAMTGAINKGAIGELGREFNETVLLYLNDYLDRSSRAMVPMDEPGPTLRDVEQFRPIFMALSRGGRAKTPETKETPRKMELQEEYERKLNEGRRASETAKRKAEEDRKAEEAKKKAARDFTDAEVLAELTTFDEEEKKRRLGFRADFMAELAIAGKEEKKRRRQAVGKPPEKEKKKLKVNKKKPPVPEEKLIGPPAAAAMADEPPPLEQEEKKGPAARYQEPSSTLSTSSSSSTSSTSSSRASTPDAYFRTKTATNQARAMTPDDFVGPRRQAGPKYRDDLKAYQMPGAGLPMLEDPKAQQRYEALPDVETQTLKRNRNWRENPHGRSGRKRTQRRYSFGDIEEGQMLEHKDLTEEKTVPEQTMKEETDEKEEADVQAALMASYNDESMAPPEQKEPDAELPEASIPGGLPVPPAPQDGIILDSSLPEIGGPAPLSDEKLRIDAKHVPSGNPIAPVIAMLAEEKKEDPLPTAEEKKKLLLQTEFKEPLPRKPIGDIKGPDIKYEIPRGDVKKFIGKGVKRVSQKGNHKQRKSDKSLKFLALTLRRSGEYMPLRQQFRGLPSDVRGRILAALSSRERTEHATAFDTAVARSIQDLREIREERGLPRLPMRIIINDLAGVDQAQALQPTMGQRGIGAANTAEWLDPDSGQILPRFSEQFRVVESNAREWYSEYAELIANYAVRNAVGGAALAATLYLNPTTLLKGAGSVFGGPWNALAFGALGSALPLAYQYLSPSLEDYYRKWMRETQAKAKVSAANPAAGLQLGHGGQPLARDSDNMPNEQGDIPSATLPKLNPQPGNIPPPPQPGRGVPQPAQQPDRRVDTTFQSRDQWIQAEVPVAPQNPGYVSWMDSSFLDLVRASLH